MKYLPPSIMSGLAAALLSQFVFNHELSQYVFGFPVSLLVFAATAFAIMGHQNENGALVRLAILLPAAYTLVAVINSTPWGELTDVTGWVVAGVTATLAFLTASIFFAIVGLVGAVLAWAALALLGLMLGDIGFFLTIEPPEPPDRYAKDESPLLRLSRGES